MNESYSKSILFYTITSNRYINTTNLMLESLFKNIDMFTNYEICILCIDKIDIKFSHKSITYIDCQNFLKDNLCKVEHNIKDIYISRSAYWLKSQIFNIHNRINNYNTIIYLDSDILFFHNIAQYVSKIVHNNQDTLFIQSDTKRKFGTKHNCINTGFLFAHINYFLKTNLMKKWSEQTLDIYNNKHKIDRLLWKYPDQKSLQNLLSNYKYQILCPYEISIKNKDERSILCHYFSKHIKQMHIDYNNFIKSP